jgi:tetratricopeptide (TPR) repeat protein
MLLSSTRFLLMAALMAVMAGCSIAPTQAPQPPVDDRGASAEPAPPPVTEPEPSEPAVASPLPDSGPSAEPAPSSPQPVPRAESRQKPAVLALLSQAEQSRAQGDYRGAQGSLQRAQRIDPRDAEVYYSLALTHMELEDYDLAEQVALKGVSVAQGNNTELKRLWNLLAKIRLRAGDPAGSQAASDKAARY